VGSNLSPPGRGPEPPEPHGRAFRQGTGRWETVIQQAKQDIAARPDAVFGYQNLTDGYFLPDRFDEAEKVLQQASARKLETADHLIHRYTIASLRGEKGQMDRAVALAKGKREAERRVANSEALVSARSGQLQQAHELSSRAVNLAQQEGAREAAATYQAVQAVWEALYGNAAEGKRNAIAALKLSKGRDIQYAAALALGFAGDASQSEAKDSIEQLQVTLPYELAVNGLDINLSLGGLHSAYVRGEAFLADHRYAEAAAEFQKILDHRGIVGLDPIGALAHLQLGRVFALSGDKIKAKTAYEAFLSFWKDADPDVPILKSAKAEYGRL
jgi:eukaryotic-like serine/threonine-protein kinase